jgi:hypothetical protein
MKRSTRDNLIYLALGLGIAGLVAFDAFYSDFHNRKMWMPSRFAFNAVSFMLLLAYMVVRETQKVKATILQTVVCVVAACFVHSGVVIAFPQIFAKPYGAGLWVFIVLELFLLVRLMVQVVRYIEKPLTKQAARSEN